MKNAVYDISDKLDGWDVTFAMHVPEGEWWNVQCKLQEGETVDNELYDLVTKLRGYFDRSWSLIKAEKNEKEQTWDLTMREVPRVND